MVSQYIVPQEIRSFIQYHYSGEVHQVRNKILIPELNLHFTYCTLLSTPSAIATIPKEDASLKIWEDHWHYKKTVIQSRLLSLLGKSKRIHARKTQVSVIAGQEARDFLDAHHILGGTVAKYKYGLRNEVGQLLAVMTFSKGRNIIRQGQVFQSYELIRHSNLSQHTVVGGLSKLLKAFIRDHKPDDIVTYVGMDWSSGSVYEQFGFELAELTKPGWLWIDPKTGKRWSSKRNPDLGQDWKVAYYPGNRKYLLKLIKPLNEHHTNDP